MSRSFTLVPGDTGTSKYVITHVFCPLQLPDGDDHSVHSDHSLARAVATAARLYSRHVGTANIHLWHSISRMLQNLQALMQFESLDRLQTISQFSSMDVGDVVALLIRAQNAGVVFRKQKDATIFESFELSPKAADVMTTEGKLICSYPGPAIEIPNLTFDDKNFLSELVNFLAHMNHDNLDVSWHSYDSKDTVHPRYITELLTGILRGVGRPADITRISKRVGDEVVCNDDLKFPWRRSPLWLLIRVSLQMTLYRSPLGNHTYKKFMLFFMCCLVEEKTCADLPNDFLQFMSTKISRRLQKLGSSAPDWLSRIVLQVCTSLRSTIENRWRHVHATQRVSPPWTPSLLDLTRDIQLSLSGSGDYLRNSLADHRINTPNISFNPEHRRRGALDDFLSADGEFFEEAYRVEPYVTLYDVEQAVEQDIDVWVSRVTNNGEACVKLEILAEKYSSGAFKTYANNPELLSVMLLTTVELWVALDKIAVKEIPILADYSPEVPISLLEGLLLCKTTSRHRLGRAYVYLSRRHSRSRHQWSVFSPAITVDSFAVRFYSKSSHLRRLRTQIEQVAWGRVHEKVAELRGMNARYAELRKRETETGQAESNMDMRIAIYERPLPSNQLHAEVVVFELDCPVSFNMWRAATFHLLVDLCSPPIQQSDRPHLELSGHQALEPFYVKHPRSRVSLGSNTRSSNFSHPSVPIPAKQEQVCIHNRLTFFGFDMCTGVPISQALGRIDSRGHCTYKLQNEPYLSLQKYVDTTSHTSNEVIANQADCHEDLSIHEYMAFGHLRSGGLLQWLNILRELRSRSLSFRHHEVHMLLAQAVSQIGPLENMGWTWHLEIQQPTFCYALLGELENLVREVEANWLEGVTMDTISHLLRRLLASSPNDAVSLKALYLLRLVRGKVFSWTQELSAELLRAPGDEGSRGVLRDTAAICRSTFDVDPAMIPKVLHSPEDIDVLLSCAIIIHDHMPIDVSTIPAYSQLLLDRDRRIALAVESVARDMIQADASDEGIDRAIGRFWPDYHPGSKWSSLQDLSSRWFSCTTAPPGDQRPQVAYLNILDGSLLVDGRPLGSWLPNEFVRDPLYKLLLGEQMLAVTQSDLPGMDYSTRGLISNHQVYFSLRNNGSHLVIQAKRKEMDTGVSEIIELIPPRILEGDLPAVLIEGHAHWLNLSTSVMEIRPLKSPWEASPKNWKLDCIPGHYRMRKDHEHLVDVRSQSWAMVSRLLRPLGTPEDLIISVLQSEAHNPTSTLQLSVLLPRYDLSFYVDEDWELQSRNIRGMVYDENQSIGTLFGLVNQLVLRPKNRDTDTLELIPRCVLIPDGDVSFRIDGHHVRVEITADRSVVKRVMYQTYRVNTELGCLIGPTSLTSKLYCAYLHALTSGCGDDPLTGRSGTEEALSVLRLASCWSDVRLGPRDAELLGLIASIYPPQTWDPKQLIQKMEWRNLPANAQNHEFYLISKAIKDDYERVQLFHESQSNRLFEKFPIRDGHLLKRSARRAAYLFPFQLSRQHSGANFDALYRARDVVEVVSGEHRAYTAATFAYRRTATSRKDLWKMVESWTKHVSRTSGEIAQSLQYDRSWLSPDLPLIWLEIYNLLRESDERKWFQLLFSLPAMAFSSSSLSELVPVFVAFASHSQFRFEDPPHYDSYPIVEGYFPLSTTLQKYVTDCAYPLERSPEYSERAVFRESLDDLKHRQLQLYAKRRRWDANVTAQELLEAWPCETPPQCSLDPALYDVTDLESKVQQYFFDCFRNLRLKEHLTRVQNHLNDLHSEASPPRGTHLYSFHPSQSIPSCIPWLLTVDQLFARPAPQLPAHEGLPTRYATDTGNTSLGTSTPQSNPNPLHQLIATIWANPVNLYQRRYVSALRRSAKCFGSEAALIHQKATNLPDAETLEEHYAWCKSSYTSALQHLQRYLGPRSESEQILEQSGQWPRNTPYALFRSLASNAPIKLSDDWRRSLVRFALLALELQRARRLFLLHINELHEELYKELQNEGCDGWNAEAHPDWLLIQLQGNFLIRRVQAEVAYEIMSPRSGENTVMQLNMGEGKSSVIVPIASVTLANGDQLVRVIVPKPLTAQTLHLLADRLGGLANRRIYYLPFSRSLEIDHQKVAFLREIMLECMRERGILVVQPEHVLSLKLVSVEKQLSRAEDGQVAHLLLGLQRWLHSHSREILDESDEILDVRSQLAFTIGHQQHVEGAPERWTTTQQVLGLVSKYASSLRELFPLGVEYEPGPPGSFPYVRILQADAGQKLVSWIVQDVIDGLLLNISFGRLHFQSSLRDAIRSFISCEDVSPATVQLVKTYSEQTPLWGGLLLLRGLLATDTLLFAFRERRWRVDYGLAPARTMLAVPYRAKDVPAQRAEFGHPEIAIILTYLSYYYDGLTEDQLKVSFGILLKQHDASSDYDLWVRACPAVPEAFRTLSGVNIESAEQWNKSLFPLFSRNRATVDFYLSRVVFPREANEFPSKLSSSGCDLVEKKERLVTGFSGTNDGQYLLPLHIAQRDPDHQRGTNAKVLSYLLQPENNHYMCMAHTNGNRRPTREFLEILVSQKPEIRVLLDVGAQMLDLQNHELAKAWLDIYPDPSAAIYFNEVDELTVLTRDGVAQLLLSSPYAEQLDRCVVYLDDAHTRGTDIKFPIGFRAAVTLGPKVTKDRLAQGCMRMRMLGNSHSVTFFAPLEVDQRIRSLAGKDPSDIIDTIDILHWTIRETWENVQRWAPHWVQQGMDHASRYAAWSTFCGDQSTLEELSDKWLQPATKKLEDLYQPRNTSNAVSIASPDIRQRYSDLGVLSSWSVIGVDEEQERELVHDVKRQAERPPSVQPANHSIHRDVVSFVKTGVIPKRTIFTAWTRLFTTWTKAFTPAFETLHATSAASDESFIWSQSVLVTTDFEQTVKVSGKIDDYLRPVHWILSAKRASNDLLVILSPHEANYLLPNIRSSKKVHLHLYAPRITKSVKPYDGLAVYSVPTVPNGWIPPYSFMDQLNVFAGQLYLKDYKSYIRLCRFLCLYARDLEENKDVIKVEPDGFIMPENRSQTLIAHTFSSSPIPFLKALMDLRGRGINFSSTHMGRLLRGQLLSEDDFDD